MPAETRWHPYTRATLIHLGFSPGARDMTRGNWRISPEKAHREGGEELEQYPLTLEHEVRGVVLRIYEPTMLDLLRMLG